VAHGIFLLEVTPRRLLGAAAMAAIGIVLIEIAYRVGRRLRRLRPSADGAAAPVSDTGNALPGA
jgi:hypothetical protein